MQVIPRTLRISFICTLALATVLSGLPSNAQGQSSASSSASPRSQSGQEPASTFEVLSDTQGVDFGPYLRSVLHSVQAKWQTLLPAKVQKPTLAKGVTAIRFKISPDGKVSGMSLDASTHDDELNRAAWNAIKGQQFAPLPAAFTGPNLEIRILFRVNEPSATSPETKPS